jgi:steroid delta-isomerase
MLPRQQVVDAVIEAHHRWNSRDREGWIAMWHPDAVIDDPVGAATKHGLDAVAKSWDEGFSQDPWFVVPGEIHVCGNAAAFTASHLSILDGRRVLMTDIEIWELADDGRFIRVAAYYEPLAGTPDYFLPTDGDPAA